MYIWKLKLLYEIVLCENLLLERTQLQHKVHNIVTIESLFICSTFRQVHKRDLALISNNLKSYIAFIWDETFSRVTSSRLLAGEISVRSCRICGKGMVFYNMAQYGWLYHRAAKLIQQLADILNFNIFGLLFWYKKEILGFVQDLYKKEILGFKNHVIKNMKNNRKFVKHGNFHLRVSSTFLLPKVLKIVY